MSSLRGLASASDVVPSERSTNLIANLLHECRTQCGKFTLLKQVGFGALFNLFIFTYICFVVGVMTQ